MPAATSQLLSIAADAAAAFPDTLSAHLILKADAAPPGAIDTRVPVWLDTEGRLHRSLHPDTRTLILVRPDGYIGFRCQPADGGSLVNYLGSYLVKKGL